MYMTEVVIYSAEDGPCSKAGKREDKDMTAAASTAKQVAEGYAGAWTKFSTSFDSGCCGTTSGDAKTLEHAFKVGFRLYLNEQTLKFNDRMGTTLDIVDPITSAYRAFGRTWNLTNGRSG